MELLVVTVGYISLQHVRLMTIVENQKFTSVSVNLF